MRTATDVAARALRRLRMRHTLTLHRSIRRSGAHEVAEATETIAYHPPTRPSPTGALAVAAEAFPPGTEHPDTDDA